MTNIFHTLAEKAFEGRYLLNTAFCMSEDLMPYSNALRFWQDWVTCAVNSAEFYESTNSAEEQALALLFIGEMYEDSKD
jgi:hypothetical protein